MTQLTLDSAASEALKREGLDAIEQTDGTFIEQVRDFAIKRSQKYGVVSSDDLRVWAADVGLKPKHPNSWGSIFRGPHWKIVDRKKSAVPGNHSREIKVWRYEA